MNSLNILSARVSPPPSPVPTRTNSLTTIGLAVRSDDENGEHEDGDACDEAAAAREKNALKAADHHHTDDFASKPHSTAEHDDDDDDDYAPDEHTPLLSYGETKEIGPRGSLWHVIPRRIATTFINSLRWVLSTLAAPGVYLIACLYDENGRFAPGKQLRMLFGGPGARRRQRKMHADPYGEPAMEERGNTHESGHAVGGRRDGRSQRLHGSSSSSSGLSSESESDRERGEGPGSGGGGSSSSSTHSRHTRSKSLPDSEEIAPARRSIRIKLHADDSLRQRKHKKNKSAGAGEGSETGPRDISAQLKSPTSPVAALTKYPKTPAPPRPLIPRRQPSYLNIEAADPKHQKTLILDLDETLIHSMSKGGRMGSGHMVEVRLSTTYVGVNGQASIGPQHPILYYVHKRPYCDDFLRRVRLLLCSPCFLPLLGSLLQISAEERNLANE